MRSQLREVITAAFLASLVISCAQSNRRQDAWQRILAADSLTLERTTCFGTCPAYRLRVTRTGAVLFVSRNPDDSGRSVTDSVSPQTYTQLLEQAQMAQVLDLPEEIARDQRFCPSRATDLPSATVTIFMPGLTKRVDDYHGCFWAPAALRDFERAIDQMLGSQRWVRPARRRP
jgi:hypothetical protein